MEINLKVKLYLEDENGKFMGIGVLWLLQTLEKAGSLRKAAIEMGISYSKAYAMITNLEKALDKQIVKRHKGGVNRSGAELTNFGKKFILLYDSFQKQAKDKLEEPFLEFSSKLNFLVQEEKDNDQ